MPFLQYDVDAKKKVPLVARAAGLPVAEVGWSLLELWEHVWMAGSDTVTELVLSGCIGPSEPLRAALVAFGFLERTEDGAWRVKGTDRYSKAEEARSKGGKAAAGNLIPGARHKAKTEASLGSPSAAAESQPRASRENVSAAYRHNREPITDNQEEQLQQQQVDAASRLLAFWNEHANPKLARVRAMTSNRKTALRARLKEHQPEELEEAIRRIGASSFCLGGGSQGWVADLDWLLRPGTVAKVLEGKYDDRGATVVPLRVPCAHEGCGADSERSPYGTPLCESHAREHEAFYRGAAP